MDTPFTNARAWYGEYVRKSYPVIFASEARVLERENNENATRLHISNLEIEEAHRQLDTMGVPRLQQSGLPFSLVGRLRQLHAPHKNQQQEELK